MRSSEVRPEPVSGDWSKTSNQVSEAELRGWVEAISVPRHFSAQPESNRRIRDWLKGLFESWGYTVTKQGPWDNVVAVPPGAAGEMLLIGAHYDSVSLTPGADDNGSAVAAMLGCAKVLAQVKPRPAVMFVAFNREEDDLAGSKDFVKQLDTLGHKVTGAHVLEMVGFASSEPGSQKVPPGVPIKLPTTGDFLGLLGSQKSGGLLDRVLGRAHAHLPEFPVMGLKIPFGVERFFPVLLRSDHAPFWAKGIPAVMWTDTSEFRNPNYHLPTDTPGTLNYAYLRNVTQLLTASAMT